MKLTDEQLMDILKEAVVAIALKYNSIVEESKGNDSDTGISIPDELKWQRYLNPLVMRRYLRSLGLRLERDEVTKNDVLKLTY